MLLLTLFAMGILLIDLMLRPEWKWVNPMAALVGIGFAAAGVWRIQSWYHTLGPIMARLGFMGTLVVDRFAIYFFYLFLAGTAVAVLKSVRYRALDRRNPVVDCTC